MIGQFVHPVGREGDGVKEVDGEIFNLSSYKFHFHVVHDNLV